VIYAWAVTRLLFIPMGKKEVVADVTVEGMPMST